MFFVLCSLFLVSCHFTRRKEEPDNGGGVPNAELDVILMAEPGAFVKRFPFDKKSPDGMVRLKIFIGPHPMER